MSLYVVSIHIIKHQEHRIGCLSPESSQFSPVQRRKLKPDINGEVHDNPYEVIVKVHIENADADFGEDYRKYESYIKFNKVKIEKYDDKKLFRDFMENKY